MNYDEFTKDQLINALKSVRQENAILQTNLEKYRKEVKVLKEKYSAFESSFTTIPARQSRYNIN